MCGCTLRILPPCLNLLRIKIVGVGAGGCFGMGGCEDEF